MNFFEQVFSFINQGGAVSWVIASLYLVVATVTVERVVVYIITFSRFSKIENILKTTKDPHQLYKEPIIIKYRRSQSVQLLQHYMHHCSLGPKAFNETVERRAYGLIADMEKHIWILSQVGHIAPLLGLFGTVIGLIEAFQIMSIEGATADASSFASGIWVAMITTALGLAVAIPSFFIFRLFEKVVEDRSAQMSAVVSILNEMSDNDDKPAISFNRNHKNEDSREEDIHETF